MITLTGTLRQSGQVTMKEKDSDKERHLLKIWVEHTMPRDNGTPDLKIEEFFVDPGFQPQLPKDGAEINLAVRPYPSGRDIRYQVTGILPARKAA